MNFYFLDKFNKYLFDRIPILVVLFLFINILANIPSLDLLSDILSHFKIQYFYISIIFLIVTVYLTFFKRIFIIYATVAVITAVFNIFAMVPYFIPQETIKKKPELTIALSNVLTSNTNYHGLLDEINKHNPDIIVLQETDDIWLNNIKNLKENYPYNIEKYRFDNFGVALYSKIPLTGATIEKWTNLEVPVIKVSFKFNNQEIILYGIHTLPPTSIEYLNIRNEMLENIAHLANKFSNRNLIIVGDLNTTQYSYAFKKYITNSKLIDTQTANKIFRGTWNTRHFGFMRIALDHVLISQNLQCSQFKIGNNIGSDHFPIFVKITTKQ